MILKWTLIILTVLIGLILLIVLTFNISPVPGSLVIRKMFDSGKKITSSQAYTVAREKIAISSDQSYESNFKNHTFDIYRPKDQKIPRPVLIWVHGGGYVGGDKKDVKEFATRIAADANIVVISMNYQRAPESQYPNQLFQVDELMKSLENHPIPLVNLSKIILGGDSAGAQIAFQYIITQTNPTYGKHIGIDQTVGQKSFKGAISYCGPLNLKQMIDQSSGNSLVKFFNSTVAWSELGTKNWQRSGALQEASLVEHVTKNFPSTYLTDGNTYSFQEQGAAFENKLKTLGVSVQGLFFTKSKEKLVHEYQFNYQSRQAEQCYGETLEFVKEHENI